MATGDPCACGMGMLGSCPKCSTPPRALSDYEAAQGTLRWYEERLRVVEAERDAAREECGYEKGMRRFLREELDRWIRKAVDAERRADSQGTES